MKKLTFVLIVLIIVASCISVFASDVEYSLGEVIYHQDFSDISNFSNSGIKVGALSTPNASYICNGEALTVSISDGGRAYNILPDIKTGSDYTVELTFAFTGSARANGYIAFMLTCRGEDPSNITPITFRADGSIDDFSDIPEELSKSIAAGEKISVKIPVENDTLYHIMVSAGGNEYHIERDSMITIADGNMGLMYRYASVAVSEIYIVNGIDYLEKSGEYLDKSFAEDNSTVVTPGIGQEGNGAPATSDGNLITLLAVFFAAGLLTVIMAKKIYESLKYR